MPRKDTFWVKGRILEVSFLSVIVLFAFILRLHDINRPLADWHSWRQADTAAISRNYVKDGIDFLHPKYDDYSSTQSGFYDTQRYRMVEFPIYNAIVSLIWQHFGVREAYARIVSIFFSEITLIFLYLLVKKFFGQSVGLLTALVFAIMPYNIFYSTTILPEPLLLAASTATLYFTARFTDKFSKIWFSFSIIAFALALLVKPFAVFIILPISYLFYLKFGIKFVKNKYFWGMVTLSLVPFLIWRLWISQYPEGIPASGWLLNGDGIRLKGAFFRWIFIDRFGRLIFTVAGLPLLVFGLVTKMRAGNYIFHFWFLSILIYFVIFATGNVRHDYYQIPIIPAGSFLVAFGFYQMWNNRSLIANRVVAKFVAALLLIGFYAFGWYEARQLFGVNDPAIVQAGVEADRILPKDAKIIAPYNQNTAFLYQTQRYGWSDWDRSLPDLLQAGATYVVAVKIDNRIEDLAKKYKVIERNSQFVIIDLTSPVR